MKFLRELLLIVFIVTVVITVFVAGGIWLVSHR